MIVREYHDMNFGWLRVATDGYNIYFFGEDVCRTMKITNVEKLKIGTENPFCNYSNGLGGEDVFWLLNISELCLLSLKADSQLLAEGFVKWILRSVLPAHIAHLVSLG
jgi:prophage antirepressor-like protein